MSSGPSSVESDAARYSRQLVLPGFGASGQKKLALARVLIVGAGGLGSTVIPSLAAAGVGTIGIVDADRVELSNLARQTIHTPRDVGRPKVQSAAESAFLLNPSTNIQTHDVRLTAHNALEILADYDIVIDGSDNFPTRYLVDDAAALRGIPNVWGAVSQFGGQVGVSWNSEGPTYRDLFPDPPPPGSVPSCEGGGVLPTVCAVVGSIMSTETLKLITGLGVPLIGRVTTYDARSGRFRELEFGRSPDASPVTELIDYELFCGVGGERVAGNDVQTNEDDVHRNELDEQGNEVGARAIGARAIGARENEVRAHDNGVDTQGKAADAQRNEVQGHRGDRIMAANEDISAQELATTLGAGETVQLLDVREEWEAEIAAIPGSTLIPLGQLAARWNELDPDATTVVYCHSGVRSLKGRDVLRSLDFADVRSLTGGVDAWSREVDPTVARY